MTDILPDSRYTDEENGLILEWLAGNAAKRKEFFCWLHSLKKLESILTAIERDCDNG